MKLISLIRHGVAGIVWLVETNNNFWQIKRDEAKQR